MTALKAFLATPRGAAIAALFLTLLAVLPGQASIPPIDRDEPRFAQATRQMVETGDYIDIRYLDAPRYLQPAGIYWLQAAAVKIVGDPQARAIWPHRVPSWLAALGTVFLTWWIGALLFGRDAGRIAAALMGACLILGVEARLAKIDSTLCAVTALAQAALARAFVARERQEKLSFWWAVLFWSALGFGGLLKGPIVLLVTGGAVLALLAIERRARWLLSLRPLWGVPLMLAIAAPWYIAIGEVTHGRFYQTAVGYSVAGKIAGTHQRHGGAFGYHTAFFSALFWPGSLLAWLAAPFVWAQRARPEVRFCLAWIVPAWLVFELSGTKLPHYTLPLLPAVAMLSAAALVDANGKRWLGRPRLFAVAATVWVLISALLTMGPPAARIYIQKDAAFGPLLLGGLAFFVALLALALTAQGRARAAVAALVGAALLAWTNLFQFTLPAMTQLFLSPRIEAAAVRARPCADSRLALLDFHEPSLVFLHGPGVVLTRSAAEAADFLAADPVCGLVLVGEPNRAALLADLVARGLTPAVAATVSGSNYNEGGGETLTLLTVRQ